jgi:hypothetical protein
VLVRARLDERRRPWRREQAWAQPPEPVPAQPGSEAGLDRVILAELALHPDLAAP